MTVLGCGFLAGLGVWQIERGLAKAAYIAQQQSAQSAAPASLRDLANSALPPAPHSLHVQARGHYLGAQQLLMDGQSHGDQLGYDVLTPFLLRDGSVVLVNRGWVPRRSSTQHGTPVPLLIGRQPRQIDGLWRRWPQPGLRLDAHNCRGGGWPRYVSYPDEADVRCIYRAVGHPVRPGVVELGPRSAGGFVRDWSVSYGFPPIRHYGYAAQWFMFCIIGLYFFYRLNQRVVTAASDDRR
ncbi:MAG TPA: SURF1 family protein [Nevskiaceae bacterium]|nr:SURF1 family protein [Nevskiaceae bacterium]